MTEPRMCLLLAASAPEGELHRIPVAMVAHGFKGKQKFSVTRADLAAMVKNFRKRGTGDLPIDYDHSIEFAAGAGEPVPAAGWLQEIDDAPDSEGVLWGKAKFTERAAAMVAASEYRYISPVVVWGARDKDSGEPQGTTLTSLALTNSPLLDRLPRLPALACSDAGWEISRGDAGDGGTQEKEKRVVKTLIMADRVARTVRAVLDDGTESILTVEGLETQPKVITMSDVKRGADGKFNFTSVPQEKGVLVASDVFAGFQAQGELDAAVEKGLITPAQRPFYETMAFSDIESFRKLVATMAPAVDFKEHGHGGSGEGIDAEKELLAAVATKQKADPTLQYHQALKLVATENPALNARYTQLMRERGGKGE